MESSNLSGAWWGLHIRDPLAVWGPRECLKKSAVHIEDCKFTRLLSAGIHDPELAGPCEAYVGRKRNPRAIRRHQCRDNVVAHLVRHSAQDRNGPQARTESPKFKGSRQQLRPIRKPSAWNPVRSHRFDFRRWRDRLCLARFDQLDADSGPVTVSQIFPSGEMVGFRTGLSLALAVSFRCFSSGTVFGVR